MPSRHSLPLAGKFDVVLAILCSFFGNVEARKTVLMFIMPFFYAFKPLFRQESVCSSFLINLGKWAFRMLLPEPARLFGSPVLEIQGFFSAFRPGTERTIARYEEHIDFVTRLKLQSFPVSMNCLIEAAFTVETMFDI